MSIKLASPATVSDQAAVTRLIADHAADAIFLLDEEGHATYANAAAEEMFGWPSDELRGAALHDLIHHHHPDGREFPMSECPISAVLQTGRGLRLHEDVFFHRCGRQIAVSCSNAAIKADGRTVGGVLIVRDITERKSAEQERELLLGELNHRVKNLLTVVQAIVNESVKGEELCEVRTRLAARLRALARAQDILTASRESAASIEAVISGALAPFVEAGRLTCKGPHVSVHPRQVVALGLALHELATNALKYGALSVPEGSIFIHWTVQTQGDVETLTLLWQENGGPQVVTPQRRGFGSRMIERALASAFGGSAQLEFEAKGLVCTLTAPLR